MLARRHQQRRARLDRLCRSPVLYSTTMAKRVNTILRVCRTHTSVSKHKVKEDGRRNTLRKDVRGSDRSYRSKPCQLQSLRCGDEIHVFLLPRLGVMNHTQ